MQINNCCTKILSLACTPDNRIFFQVTPPSHDLHVAFKIPNLCDIFFHKFRQAASKTRTDHNNRNVRNSGQGIFQHRKYRRLNLAKLELTRFQVLRAAVLARPTSTKCLSFCMAAFSASLKKLTAHLPQSHDRSCYVSRPILAPPPL